MKGRKLLAIFVVCMAVLLFSLCACNGTTPSTPQKLSAPIVTLDGNVASWQSDANADRLEISLDGTLTYLENTVTQKTLANGQSLKVRFVGDGVNYSTSDWSNVVTYTESEQPQEPTKLQAPTVSISQTGLAT